MNTRGHTITENTASKFTSADMLAPKRYVCLHLHTRSVHGAHTLLLPFFLPFVHSYYNLSVYRTLFGIHLQVSRSSFSFFFAYFGRRERKWEIMVECRYATVYVARDNATVDNLCLFPRLLRFFFTLPTSILPGLNRFWVQIESEAYACVIELSEKSKWKMWVNEVKGHIEWYALKWEIECAISWLMSHAH